MPLACGLDLGGTKLLGVVVDTDRPGEPVAEERVPTPRGSEAVVAAIVATVCLVIAQNERDFIPYWARCNYKGYEGGEAANFTAKSFPEYRAFLDTANSLAPGRMLWEGGDAIGA